MHIGNVLFRTMHENKLFHLGEQGIPIVGTLLKLISLINPILNELRIVLAETSKFFYSKFIQQRS
jgi:hypothetical protein